MFDWITSFIENTGYFGIALLMFAENVFPPIPSQLIMPLAGFTAARGDMSIVLATISGVTGSLIGMLFWYSIARWVGSKRLKQWTGKHGRWLTMTPDDVDAACRWFHHHGRAAVFFGPLVPGVRTLISVPAGIAGMSLTRFLLYCAGGTTLWTALLAGAGYLLESNYKTVANWVNPISNVIVGALVVWYVYRVITFKPAGKQASN